MKKGRKKNHRKGYILLNGGLKDETNYALEGESSSREKPVGGGGDIVCGASVRLRRKGGVLYL